MMTHPLRDQLIEDRYEITPGTLSGYTIGLDLGKSQDFTAISIAETWKCERIRWQKTRFQPMAEIASRRPVNRYRVVNVRRYPRGTPYPDIYRSVQSILAQLPATPMAPSLFVDRTGVGGPVVDAMREMGIALTGISITGGSRINRVSSQDVNVPKALLASSLDIAFAEDRLELTSEAESSDALRAELQGFRVKKTSHGNETMEAWREGIHDDLVLATAMAIWGADNRPKPVTWIKSPVTMGR